MKCSGFIILIFLLNHKFISNKYNKIRRIIHIRLDIYPLFCKFRIVQINDRIYGRIEINDKVLLALIDSLPVQRLKGINQAGASQYVIAGKTVTRYEHSLGVMTLLRKLGASLEEQIAGLLHDVPHTAFSHVIDFVFPSDDHAYHEKFHSDIILNSEIPDILADYNYDVHRILDDSNFPLLERSIPDLCADRIDYSLRDMTASLGYNEKIQSYIDNITIHNNEIIFKDPETARRYAEDYLMMDRTRWSHPLEIAYYQILAEAMKLALEKGILDKVELFKDDSYVYSKLQGSNDSEIKNKLSMLSPGLTILDDPDDYQFFARNKVRYVNPKFMNGQREAQRLSETYPDFNAALTKHIERITRGNYIKILSY